MLKAGELREHIAYYNSRIQELGKQYNRAVKAERMQRDELEQLRSKAASSEADLARVVDSYKQLSKNYEQLKQKYKTVDSIADDFFSMLKKYPATMGKVLQSYANSVGRDVSYSEGGVCIGSAKCKVRKLER